MIGLDYFYVTRGGVRRRDELEYKHDEEGNRALQDARASGNVVKCLLIVVKYLVIVVKCLVIVGKCLVIGKWVSSMIMSGFYKSVFSNINELIEAVFLKVILI